MSKRPVPIPRKPKNILFKRALYTYEAVESDELDFKEGDLLYIIDSTSSPDWWRARLKDKEGLVPSNYFTQIENSNGRDNNEEINPFLDACKRGNLELLEDCLAMKVPVNHQDVTGNGGLHYASKSGHTDIVERLLKIPKIRTDLRNRDGDTPLHKSAEKGRLKITSLLIAIDPSCLEVKNSEGFTPLELATDIETKAELLKHLSSRFNNGYSLEEYEKSDSDE